jgi:hypothetical protein
MPTIRVTTDIRAHNLEHDGRRGLLIPPTAINALGDPTFRPSGEGIAASSRMVGRAF